MPYRRRRRRRRSRYGGRGNRRLQFRLGNINAAGGRPVTPHSRTLNSVTCSSLVCTAVTCGDNMVFNIMDWSAPASPDGGTFTEVGTGNNHPSGHVDVVADGFDRVKVLNALYRLNFRFKGDDNEAQDWIVAYRFSNTSANILTHTAGTVGIDNWKDVRQSRGWVYKRFSATHSGGSIHPSSGVVSIRVANVGRLAYKMEATTSGTDFTRNDYTHNVADAAQSADINCFLHIEVFTIDGVALSAGDIHVDVDVFMKVKLWKFPSDNNVERADQEG